MCREGIIHILKGVCVFLRNFCEKVVCQRFVMVKQIACWLQRTTVCINSFVMVEKFKCALCVTVLNVRFVIT